MLGRGQKESARIQSEGGGGTTGLVVLVFTADVCIHVNPKLSIYPFPPPTMVTINLFSKSVSLLYLK